MYLNVCAFLKVDLLSIAVIILHDLTYFYKYIWCVKTGDWYILHEINDNIQSPENKIASNS